MPDKLQDDDLVMGLVELALTRRAEEREVYLREACEGDSALFNQVWTYIQWEERMQGFLQEPLCPALDEPHFRPGDFLDGRFRIVREVAQGGMGVVYEAWDEKLERRIAIKCAKAGFRKRLTPEVRNAREISHVNVCKIFDIHTAATEYGEVDFLAMEFVEGETLAERLERGRLSEPEARTIARQLCAGLGEAHRNQVIHGDLKSRNVMLAKAADGSTRAVIMDFGLARRPEAAQVGVPSGEAAGTPDYMAPELWKGGKASVASDIYALGVILHELVTGGRPPELAATGRLVSVHPKWDRMLARCLDPDPARRFASADQVARVFEPAHARRWILAATAAAVLAIGTGVETHRRATAPRESVRLAMLPFGSGPDTAPIAASLLRDTSAQLARVSGSSRTAYTFLANGPANTAEKARDVLGATHVLHGRLSSEKGRVILNAYLTDTRSLVNAKEWKAEYAPGEVRYVPVALAGVVTGVLRLPLTIAPTVNASARQDYLTGLSYLRRNSGVDAALPLLERAVAADPDAPLTHAALAEGQWWKYFLTKDQHWLTRTMESVRQAERRNPDLAQVYRIAGLLKYDAGWYEQAAADYRRAIELEPGNDDAYRRLGMALEANNQLDEALAAYRQAIDVGTEHYRNYQALGAFYSQQANYTEAARNYRKTVELVPDEPTAHFLLGLAYSKLGLYADSEKALRFSISLGETPTALHTLGVVLIYQQKEQAAIPFILSALSRWPERHLWWMNLGVAYRRINLPAESERANRRGLELVEAAMTRNPRDGYVRSCLAYLCARLGDRRRAESEIAQALQQSPANVDARWMAAKTYEALGRREDTLAVLRDSPNGVLAEVNRYPDLADLHKDSRFIQLVASRQVK